MNFCNLCHWDNIVPVSFAFTHLMVVRSTLGTYMLNLQASSVTFYVQVSPYFIYSEGAMNGVVDSALHRHYFVVIDSIV